jgi:hypothetical protein
MGEAVRGGGTQMQPLEVCIGSSTGENSTGEKQAVREIGIIAVQEIELQ